MRKFLILFILIIESGIVYGQVKTDYQAKGDVDFANKDYRAAINDYTQAIDNSKTDSSALAVVYFYRAESHRLLNEVDAALQDYGKAVALNPKYRAAYWQRAFVYDVNKNPKSALTSYLSAIAVTDGTDINNLSVLNCNVALEECRLLHWDSALKYDSIAMALAPRFYRPYFIRAGIYTFQKKYDDAIKDWNIAIMNDPGDNPKRLSATYADRADTKRINKQYKEAINDYSFAIKLNADNRNAYWDRAAVYYQHKDYALASADYSKAITYYQGDNVNLSRLYDDRAKNEVGQSLLPLAIQDDSIAIALNPNNKSAFFDIADAYTQNGDYQKGIDQYKIMLTFPENNNVMNSELYYLIANNEYFLKEFDKVIEDCSRAVALDPQSSSAYFYRAKVYWKQMNKKQLAADDFNKVLSLDTTKQSVDYVFSLFYTGKGDEATKILNQAVLNTTDNELVLNDYYNLACLYSLMDQPDQANNYLKMAIDGGYAKKYAIADEDLDNIRNTADYQSIIAATAK